MKKIIYITVLLLFISTVASSNDTKLIKLKLYKAYIEGNNSLWLDAMNDLKKSYTQTKNIFTLYELTNSQYGYIGFLIDRNEYEKARSIISDAEKNVQKLLDYNHEWADAMGLKAGIYGFKIILFPTFVIINGPKGKNYLEKATLFNQISPYIVLEMANYKYHTPSFLGGDVDQAIKYYRYAIQLFELTNQVKDNWQYMNTLVWLAISYDKKGDSTDAKKVLNKVLSLEPDFTWVKNDLYPKILRNESISKTYFSLKN